MNSPSYVARTLASAMNSPSVVKQKNYVQPLHTYSGLAARHGSVLGEKRINLSAALKNFVPTQVTRTILINREIDLHLISLCCLICV